MVCHYQETIIQLSTIASLDAIILRSIRCHAEITAPKIYVSSNTDEVTTNNRSRRQQALFHQKYFKI